MRTLRIIGLAVAASLLWCGPASAVVPGANGKIAFDSDRDGDFNVYTIEPDGSALARLTSSEENEWDPAWSPDGRRIAYVRDFELWIMNADGTEQRQVTRRMAQVQDVSWSPNGRRVLFTSTRDEKTRGDLWTVAPDGSKRTRLTKTEDADFEASWSPNGRRIAFVRERSEAYRIYTMAPDGTKLERMLPRRMNHHFHPAWSPDGKRIAFTSSDDDLFVARADGSDRRKIAYWGNQPAWSPDGTRLAVSDQDEWGSSGVIYTMRPDGSAGMKVSPWGTRYMAGDPDWQALSTGQDAERAQRPPAPGAGTSVALGAREVVGT